MSANHFIPWKKSWGRNFCIPQDQINCSEHINKKKQSSLSNKLEELTVTDSDCGALDRLDASIGSS